MTKYIETILTIVANKKLSVYLDNNQKVSEKTLVWIDPFGKGLWSHKFSVNPDKINKKEDEFEIYLSLVRYLKDHMGILFKICIKKIEFDIGYEVYGQSCIKIQPKWLFQINSINADFRISFYHSLEKR